MFTVTNLKINHARACNETHFLIFFEICFRECDMIICIHAYVSVKMNV